LRWYIRSENESTRLEDYKNLAKKLNIKFNNESSLATIIFEVNKQLQYIPNFILIFDNVKNYQDIEEFLPNDPSLVGQIIITSQINDILPPEKRLNGFSISLNEGMSLSESVILLDKLTGLTNDDTAEKLASRVGTLPLALVQAASYISRTKISYSEYLKLYEQQYHQLFKSETLPQTYANTLNTATKSIKDIRNIYDAVLKFSFNSLSPQAQEILHLAAFLNPDNIPIELFLSLNVSEEKLKSILAELEHYSLINFSPCGKHFSIHRVIQDIAKTNLKEKRLISDLEEVYLNKILGLIHTQHRSKIITEHDYYSKRFLIPHLESILTSSAHLEINKSIFQGILDLALLYKAIGNAKQAADYYNKILAYADNFGGELAGEFYQGLGRAYQGTGRFEDARLV